MTSGTGTVNAMQNTNGPIHTTTAANHRFHLLDALRGIAAILVVPRHVPPAFTRSFPFHNSFLAVDFFFCLSGFVIGFSYEARLQTKLSLRDFLAARVIRLYPLSILATTISLIYGLFAAHVLSTVPILGVLGIFLLAIMLLPKLFVPWLGGAMFPMNSPAWSLFFEMVGNITYAILVRCRLAKTQILATISLLSLAGITLLVKNSVNLDAGYTPQQIGVGLLRVAYSFFLGVLLYRLYRRRPEAWRIQGIPALLTSAVIACALIATLSLAIPLTESQLFALFVIAFLSPALVFLGSLIELSLRWTEVCAFLGDMSYPLYILHAPLLAPLTGRTAQRFAATHSTSLPFFVIAYVFILIVLTWSIGKLLDVPFRRFLAAKYKSFTTQRQQSKAQLLAQ